MGSLAEWRCDATTLFLGQSRFVCSCDDGIHPLAQQCYLLRVKRTADAPCYVALYWREAIAGPAAKLRMMSMDERMLTMAANPAIVPTMIVDSLPRARSHVMYHFPLDDESINACSTRDVSPGADRYKLNRSSCLC